MISLLKRIIIFSALILPMQAIAKPAPDLQTTPNQIISNIKETLKSKPPGKGTVGVIPYIKKGNKTFILLGREDINDSDKRKAGTYSDLGGTTKADQTYLENMLRKLKEESMGLITPKAEYILNQGVFIVKDIKNRRIIYALIPAADKLYISASTLNNFRITKQAILTKAEAEKDEFAWLHLESLLAVIKHDINKIIVPDIDGKVHEIRLRKFFVEDFLTNPELNKALVNLK
jgi:hypothetical protein